MGLDHTNKYRGKYNFHELDIGETAIYSGNLRNIRTACCMWGTRYGIWLSAKLTDDGVSLAVTRVSAPLTKHTRRNFTINERLKKLEDGVRFMSLMLIKIKEKLEDHE